jgi:hypothetical protein
MALEDQPDFDPRLAWASDRQRRPAAYSLAPVSLLGIPAGTRVALASLS